MKPGDLTRLLSDEPLYGPRTGVYTALRGDLVIILSGSGDRNVLVLHPQHGLGVLYGPSLEAVDDVRGQEAVV